MFPKDTQILIVDDMAAQRQYVKGHLRDMGFSNLHEADDGDLALQTLNSKQVSGPAVGLVLCDWNMPVMSGLDFLKVVRNLPEYLKLPFIMITAETDKRQVIEAIKLGVSDYLIKPITAKGLEEKMLNAWNKHNS